MTEKSYWWNTGGAGDGASTYTQADLTEVSKILGAALNFEGVVPVFLNQLAPTANGINTVKVDTGGALVDGRQYENNAAVNVNIPSSVGGGNTRIDRIVLRANWSALTVRVTRIAGTDAASPTVPAITQVSGTTYDIKLCQVLVNTSGAVTVTDERVWAQLNNANQFSNNLITTAKLALNSVDDTIAGNRVPQLYRRQGGDASNWQTPGTTSYTPGLVRIQTGMVSASIAAGTGVALLANVTFPVAFSAPPIVIVTVMDTNPDLVKAQVQCHGTGASQFQIYANQNGAFSETVIVSWVAIGPQ